jgi:2-oxoglutarate ferredoxin oxidoreductase subunit alpha
MLSDLDIGMNDWVVKRLKWDDAYKPDRGRVLDAAQLEAMAKYFRYSPVDEDEVAARTLPGVHAKGAFFTRGSGHNKLGGYTETPAEYQEVVDRLARKLRRAGEAVPAPIVQKQPGASFGVITIGGCDAAVREAMVGLAAQGHTGDFMRIRGFPFGQAVLDFINAHERIFVVEQNRDGQLRTLLGAELDIDARRLHPVLFYGGFPLSARHVVDAVAKQLDKDKNQGAERKALGGPSEKRA